MFVVACLFEKNACVWSCLETSEERVIELEKLYRDSSVIFTCTPVGWKSSSNKNHMDNTLSKSYVSVVSDKPKQKYVKIL